MPTGNANGVFDIEQSHGSLASTFAEYSPKLQRLLEYAGLDPDHALVRWGNFDRTVLLPSTVFEPDETGRSYRFRPNTRSIWVRNFPMKGPVKAYFQVPDRPELAELVKGTVAQIVDGSTQTTNSWGLRGPEPDIEGGMAGNRPGRLLHAGPLRRRSRDAGGMPEARSHGPAGRTGRDLEHGSPRLFTRAILLLADRIRRAFPAAVRRGQSLRQRLRRLSGSARGQGRLGGGKLLARPDPRLLFGSRISSALSCRPRGSTRSKGLKCPGITPARSPTCWRRRGPVYLDPIAEFANAQLEIVNNSRRLGLASPGNPLFNGRIGDGHFSARGCEIWAAAVGRRLALLIEKRDLASARYSASKPAEPPCGRTQDQLCQSSRYSPITLTSTRLARRPSNSP